jgi:ATP-dependent RNA helicase RhlE
VFTRTKHGANRLADQLEQDGLTAAAIHGNKSQGARTRALADFKNGAVRVLVATDIAARGIDIDQLPHVVNYDLPEVPEHYVHRIGRTGRAGNEGLAISLVAHDERPLLKQIERLLSQNVPQRQLEGYTPSAPRPQDSARRDRPEHEQERRHQQQHAGSRRPPSGGGQGQGHRPKEESSRGGQSPNSGRQRRNRSGGGRRFAGGGRG